MIIETLPYDLTVCQVVSPDNIDFSAAFCSVSKTDEEISLVCPTKNVPCCTIKREDGWSAFRIKGVLDFSLIGILANITSVLAKHKIGLFALSTYNTDYILVKREDLPYALAALEAAGYTIAEPIAHQNKSP